MLKEGNLLPTISDPRCSPLSLTTHQVTPNDEVRGMTTNGAHVLPDGVVQGAFKGMLGKTLNFVHFKEAIGKLDGWYSEHGVLGQVI